MQWSHLQNLLSRTGGALGFRGNSLAPMRPRTRPLRGIDEFVEPIPKPDKEGKLNIPPVGRSWRASELRLKSFDDLWKLWYVLLKEKNLIYTQRETIHREKDRLLWRHYSSRLMKVKRSMGRLKLVLGEREAYGKYLMFLYKRRKEQQLQQKSNQQIVADTVEKIEAQQGHQQEQQKTAEESVDEKK